MTSEIDKASVAEPIHGRSAPMSWFQREFEKTDVGILSVITWIVILLGAGFFVGFTYLIDWKIAGETAFAIGVLSALALLLIATRPIRAYHVRCSSAGIMLISLVIVHGIGSIAYFTPGPGADLALLGTQALVYPAYLVYAILYFNAKGRLSSPVVTACLVTVGEMLYYFSKIRAG
jgi:hypothetical protein